MRDEKGQDDSSKELGGAKNGHSPTTLAPPARTAKGCGIGTVKGLLLVGGLLVAGFVVIDIPCLLDSIERSRQKRATQEVQAMATALLKFQETYGGVPPSRFSGNPRETLTGLKDAKGVPAFGLEGASVFPEKDPWGNPYRFRSGPEVSGVDPALGTVTSAHFVLGSLGSDGKEGGGEGTEGTWSAIAGAWCAAQPKSVGTLETHCYQADIVWADGSFLQAPEGKQKKCR